MRTKGIRQIHYCRQDGESIEQAIKPWQSRQVVRLVRELVVQHQIEVLVYDTSSLWAGERVRFEQH
jgi:DNA polymerase elongation subunit (family B)